MMRVIHPADAEWPRLLNELGPHVPPERLFVDGASLQSDAAAVAVVGTRRPTSAGIEAAERIAQGVAEAGMTVVSGLAVGIDAAAHSAALEAGGRTVAVLGCGLDVSYPRRNVALKERIAHEGTLVSEYPHGTPPERWRFPLRNRIIAGLSLGVVVIEGQPTSGALVTARLALDANRSVYAIPGSIRNPLAEGPNELIRTSRAALVTRVEHIFEDLAPGLVWSQPLSEGGRQKLPVDDTERAVLGALDDAPMALDRLAADLELKPGRVAAALSRLEVRGAVVRTSGGYALAGASTPSR